jgi:hypothetical protein
MKDNKKQLNKAYYKKIKNLVTSDFTSRNSGLIILNEQLKYIRDCLVLDNINDIEKEPIKTDIAIIATAIAEFEAYQLAQELQQKNFHWKNFCDFLKLNMEEWMLTK